MEPVTLDIVSLDYWVELLREKAFQRLPLIALLKLPSRLWSGLVLSLIYKLHPSPFLANV